MVVFFKFDPDKVKINVIGEVKGQDHIFDPVSNQCTSFLFAVNWTNHSRDIANRVFDLKKKKHLKFKKN